MSKINAIISDSDGTLVDTVNLIRHGQYETARQYLEKYGISTSEIPNYDTYNNFLSLAIGGSARTTLEQTMRLLYAETPHHLDAMDFDTLHEMLNPVQDQLAPEYVKPYEGLSNFLHEIGGQVSSSLFLPVAPPIISCVILGLRFPDYISPNCTKIKLNQIVTSLVSS